MWHDFRTTHRSCTTREKGGPFGILPAGIFICESCDKANAGNHT